MELGRWPTTVMAASPVEAARASELPGHRLQGRPNSAIDMVHACPRSLQAFALNDQQESAPVNQTRCPYARARGERRQQRVDLLDRRAPAL